MAKMDSEFHGQNNFMFGTEQNFFKGWNRIFRVIGQHGWLEVIVFRPEDDQELSSV